MNINEVESLNAMQVFNIAKYIAKKYGLRMPDYCRMRSEMSGKIPQPIILDSNNGRMWVDRYYVAYQLDGTSEVKYVYIAKHHVLEEISGYRNASKLRSEDFKPSKDILRQFKRARGEMLAKGCQVWVDVNEVPCRAVMQNTMPGTGTYNMGVSV